MTHFSRQLFGEDVAMVRSKLGHSFQQYQQNQSQPQVEVRDTKAEGDEPVCKVCLVNRVNTTILDCKHTCLCRGCAERILGGTRKCPVCRRAIVKGVDSVIIS